MKDYFSDSSEQYSLSVYEGDNKAVQTTQDSHADQNPIPVPTSVGSELGAALLMSVPEMIKETIRCFTDYAKCKQHEETERKRITAQLKAIEYQINAQKEVYLKELEIRYEERNRLYSMAEKSQEKALVDGDKEMLKICYNLILNVYNSGANDVNALKLLK